VPRQVIRDRGTGLNVVDNDVPLAPFDKTEHFVRPDGAVLAIIAEALSDASLHWVCPCE